MNGEDSAARREEGSFECFESIEKFWREAGGNHWSLSGVFSRVRNCALQEAVRKSLGTENGLKDHESRHCKIPRSRPSTEQWQFLVLPRT